MTHDTIGIKALLSDPKRAGNLLSSFHTAGVGTWDFSVEQNTISFDESFQNLLGLSAGNSLSYESLIACIHNEDRQGVEAAFHKLFNNESNGSIHITFKIVGINDHLTRLCKFSGKAAYNTSGLAEIVNGLAMDVSEQLAVPDEMEKLKVLVNNSPDFMGISGNAGTIQFLNKIGTTMLGIDAGMDLAKISAADFYPPQEVARMQEIYKELNKKGSWKGTIFLKHFKTNEIIPGHASFESVFNAATGELLGRSVTVRDLREELKNRKALLDSETTFRHVTQNAPTGLWMSDAEGKLIYLNKTLVDWTGMPYEDLLGYGWANAVIDEDRQESTKAFMHAIDTRTLYDVEFRINKSDGTICWCRAAGDPYYDDAGNFAGFAGFCMDIHQRVEMSEKVFESEQRIRSIVEQAPVAIGVLRGKEFKVESANQTILKLWGKDASIIGLPILKALPEIEGQGFVELLENVYNTGIPFNGDAILARMEHDGEIKDLYFDFVYAPLKNTDGSISGVLVLASDVTTQVIANKKVADSEARYRSLIEEAPVATAVYIGRELRIEIANDSMIGYWGKGKSAIGKLLADALPELEGQPFLKVLDDVFTTGKTAEFKATKVDLETEGVLLTYYFDFTYKAVRDGSGNIYGILNMAVDVTEQVLAKWQLEKSQKQLLAYFEQSPVAIAIIDKENLTFKLANPFYGELVGRKPEEIENRSLHEALPELEGQGFDVLLQRVIDTGIPFIAEQLPVEIKRNGVLETIYVNLTYQAQRSITGDITGILVVATDVTSMVRSRQQIEEAESNLRGAIDLANLGTWSLDVKTRILNYDGRLRHWFGFNADEVITAERAYAPISVVDHPAIQQSMLNAITPGTDGKYDVEYTVTNLKNGNVLMVHAQGKALLDDNGVPYKVSGTAQDVTKERKIELELTRLVQEKTEELQASNEELQAINEEMAKTNEEMEEANQNLFRSNEELSQYAYVASHDLQEPLRKIRVFSGILSKQPSLSEENKPFVEKIDRSSMRMSMLIKDLLEFSRLTRSDKMVRPVDLNHTVKDVITDFELIIAEKNAKITVQHLPIVEAVSLQMNQLFYNIISNALKFVEAGTVPEIRISAKALSPDEVTKFIHKTKPGAVYHNISVQDNGIGFEVRFSEQIFEVFKRLHGKDIYPGSGIGLALCRRIVTNHGGHLYSESALGKGTTFHIILPVYLTSN